MRLTSPLSSLTAESPSKTNLVFGTTSPVALSFVINLIGDPLFTSRKIDNS